MSKRAIVLFNILYFVLRLNSCNTFLSMSLYDHCDNRQKRETTIERDIDVFTVSDFINRFGNKSNRVEYAVIRW